MKSLASADLDFFLTTGRQLLNIGKPFYIEGIGTLVKTKDKGLEFTPGEYMTARVEDSSPERRVSYDEPAGEREPQKSNSGRRVLLAVLIFAGLLVIGWGGYYLYKRNNIIEPAPEKQAVVLPETTARRESSTVANSRATDTAVETTKSVSQPPVSPTTTPPATTPSATTTPLPMDGTVAVPAGTQLYHFVILTTENKYHALRRYNQLLGYKLNIKMEQRDSAFFKLYFPIAAAVRDTTHIKDSLADVYAAPHVFIER
jgi:hypothetical protein